MEGIVNCFILYSDKTTIGIANELLNEVSVNKVFILSSHDIIDCDSLKGCEIIRCNNPFSGETLRKIAQSSNTPYSLIQTRNVPISIGYKGIKRMTDYLQERNAGFVYSDYLEIKESQTKKHPVIDYQIGSVRDDFDFGSLIMVKSNLIAECVEKMDDNYDYPYSSLYYLRLYASRVSDIIHINEYLYTEHELDNRASGEKQFDYVNPRNREVQIDMERVFTDYLSDIDAKLYPFYQDVDFIDGGFPVEASVIIPVRNRERTIKDAIESAINQNTEFRYNIIIVDNHSTDNTTEIIDSFKNDKVIHIIPERNDLGIGGCWDLAVNDKRCGRFAVQLDSDDLYSSENALQKIVDCFYQEKCAMVIGTYNMTDFKLNTIPPGIIDHKEWSEENGRNNALRINGLGAPRAFLTSLLRNIGVPNVSYGEDYALGLRISREYRIGRIYEILYQCRRWEGNSDSALSVEQININNRYKDSIRSLELSSRIELNKKHHSIKNNDNPDKFDIDSFIKRQMQQWPLAKENHEALSMIDVKEFNLNGFNISVEHNPKRIISSGAKLDKDSISKRACFLCEKNQPEEQMHYYINGNRPYNICINPYPISQGHITIPAKSHSDQYIQENEYRDMLAMSEIIPQYVIFYNGPQCGASAPDHFHFQGAPLKDIDLCRNIRDYSQRDNLKRVKNIYRGEEREEFSSLFLCESYITPLFLSVGNSIDLMASTFVTFQKVVNKNLGRDMFNIFTWSSTITKDNTKRYFSLLIPRSKHRPNCYFASGEKNMLISPGALDMAGLIITPRKEDFDKIDSEEIKNIINEVGIDNKTLKIIIDELK